MQLPHKRLTLDIFFAEFNEILMGVLIILWGFMLLFPEARYSSLLIDTGINIFFPKEIWAGIFIFLGGASVMSVFAGKLTIRRFLTGTLTILLTTTIGILLGKAKSTSDITGIVFIGWLMVFYLLLYIKLGRCLRNG